VYNCTTRRQGRDRRDRYGARLDDGRDEFCCYHPPFYHSHNARYQQLAYTYTNVAAAAADDDDGVEDDGERYHTLSQSLGGARPVLAETQYWV